MQAPVHRLGELSCDVVRSSIRSCGACNLSEKIGIRMVIVSMTTQPPFVLGTLPGSIACPSMLPVVKGLPEAFEGTCALCPGGTKARHILVLHSCLK